MEVRLASEKKFKLFLARALNYDQSHPPQSITSHSLFNGTRLSSAHISAIVNPLVQYFQGSHFGICSRCVSACGTIFIEHSPLVLPITHPSEPVCHVLCLACFFPMCVEFNVCGAFGAIGAIGVCMQTALKSWSILLSFRRSRAQLLIKNPTSI